MSNELKILFPSSAHDDQRKPVPSPLLAMGFVRPVVTGADQKPHKVQRVQARVQHYVDGRPGDPVVKGKTRHLRPYPNTGSLQWAVLLKNAAALATTRARLTVDAYEKGNNDPVASEYVDLWLRPRGAHAEPTIDWPDTTGYQIAGDELDYFVTWGSSDLPIVSVTLGAAAATHIEWYEEEDFWWATFNPAVAPGSGTYDLTVSNADGPRTRSVDVG